MADGKFTWRVLRGIDFGDFRAKRLEPGDEVDDLPADVAEDLQRFGAIQLVSGPAPENYENWSRDELADLAERRDLDVAGTGSDGNVLKADLIGALESYDNEEGVTEGA